ncbi:hypothetical protein ACFOWX_06740 [Sphingorhabdus arenilitoris]|uniref:UrcA family protein n=1 Tax=Sphingorhabdus arenilitoris TaxID=1490041 RepID=A0ABV8RFJ3_9SPHN
MISYGVAIFLSMAAAGNPLDDARKAYNNCLVELHNKNVDAKTSASGFRKAAEENCTDERKAYIDIMIAEEKRYGSSQAEATEYATEEADAVSGSITSAYAENADKSIKLIPEP